MTTDQINDWRYPPVPQVIREALKDYPELIAEIEGWFTNPRREHGTYGSFSMSDTLSLSRRVDRLHFVSDRLKDGLSHFSTQAKIKLEAAQKSGDPITIATAQAEREAVSEARDMDVESLKEFLTFYGLVWPNNDGGIRIMEGA